MPIIGWDIRDPVTGEFPDGVPYGDELNLLLPVVCGLYGNLEQWQRDIYADLVPGGGGALPRLLTGRNNWDRICEPYGGTGQLPPASAGVPTFPENCATSGVVRSYVNISNDPQNPNWILGESFWDCDDNIGIPITQPVWTFQGGSTYAYVITFLTADGTGQTQIASAASPFGDFPERVVVSEVSVQYCPSCSLPDPPPAPPTLPARSQPQPRPVINLPITIPQQPGLPPINVNIPLSPTINIETPINLQPALTLSPNLELAPEFGFYPDFEFNFGGVSIGGGGYPEPREDVGELVDCDCPDPCPPPSADVDYQRIQDSLANVVAQRWRLPGFERDPDFGAFTGFQEAFSIDLSSDAIAVQIQLDLTNYVGGGTGTVNGVQGIGYYGWYMFQSAAAIATGATREFLSSNGGIVEVPPYSSRISVYCVNGALARARQVRLGEIPPA